MLVTQSRHTHVILSPQAKNPVVVAGLALKQYFVYIMTNFRGTLYTGVTSDLTRRVYEHRNKLLEGFTSRYNISQLVYYEATEDVNSAIAREKQIKGWRRSRKVTLVESTNPSWVDLAEGWVDDAPPPQTLRSSG